jgi:threonine synthase
VEPTCAQVASALAKLLQTGTITPEQTTVLVMTGTGIKATPTIAGLLGIVL